MRSIGVVSIIGMSLFLLSCVTKQPEKWFDIADHQKANIQLKFEPKPVQRTRARSFRSSDRWLETGVWKNTSSDEQVRIWILVDVLFDAIFSNRSKTALAEQIQELSGDGYVSLGDIGSFITKSGVVDYQFYNVSVLTCIYVENYWSDPSISGVDAIRNGRNDEYIIGNALLQAYYCDDSKESLTTKDLQWFLAGISVKNAYWPVERFKSIETP